MAVRRASMTRLEGRLIASGGGCRRQFKQASEPGKQKERRGDGARAKRGRGKKGRANPRPSSVPPLARRPAQDRSYLRRRNDLTGSWKGDRLRPALAPNVLFEAGRRRGSRPDHGARQGLPPQPSQEIGNRPFG